VQEKAIIEAGHRQAALSPSIKTRVAIRDEGGEGTRSKIRDQYC
jgi:hypothetical protein